MTFREVATDPYGRRYELDFEVTEYVENRMMAFRNTSRVRGMSKWEGSWTLEPTEAGTQLTYAADYELAYSIFGKIFDRISFHGRIERQIDGYLENIRRLAEK